MIELSLSIDHIELTSHVRKIISIIMLMEVFKFFKCFICYELFLASSLITAYNYFTKSQINQTPWIPIIYFTMMILVLIRLFVYEKKLKSWILIFILSCVVIIKEHFNCKHSKRNCIISHFVVLGKLRSSFLFIKLKVEFKKLSQVVCWIYYSFRWMANMDVGYSFCIMN